MKLEVGLGTGQNAAGCSGCGKVFTCVTAFDRHQTFNGGFRCLDPAGVGLEQKQSGRWGWKSSSYSFTRDRQKAETELQRQANTTGLVSSPRGDK